MLQRSEQESNRDRGQLRDSVNDLKNQAEKDKDKIHDLEKLKEEQTADLAKRNDEINSLRGQLDDAHKKMQDKDMKIEQLERSNPTHKEGGTVTNTQAVGVGDVEGRGEVEANRESVGENSIDEGTVHNVDLESQESNTSE